MELPPLEGDMDGPMRLAGAGSNLVVGDRFRAPGAGMVVNMAGAGGSHRAGGGLV